MRQQRQHDASGLVVIMYVVLLRELAELRQHLCDKHSGGLLAIHADGQGLSPSEKEERIEWGERVAHCVDNKRDFLREPCQLHVARRPRPTNIKT